MPVIKAQRRSPLRISLSGATNEHAPEGADVGLRKHRPGGSHLSAGATEDTCREEREKKAAADQRCGARCLPRCRCIHLTDALIQMAPKCACTRTAEDGGFRGRGSDRVLVVGLEERSACQQAQCKRTTLGTILPGKISTLSSLSCFILKQKNQMLYTPAPRHTHTRTDRRKTFVQDRKSVV